MQKQASPVAIVIAIIVLVVVLFLIWKFTLGKSKPTVAGEPTLPESPLLEPGGANVWRALMMRGHQLHVGDRALSRMPGQSTTMLFSKVLSRPPWFMKPQIGTLYRMLPYTSVPDVGSSRYTPQVKFG